MEDCLFCKIVKKEIPSQIVYEDENIIAFKDIQPATPVHVLVVPKRHFDSLNDIKKEDMGVIADIYNVIAKVVEIVSIKDSGYRVIMNCGKDSGQEVMHLHFHVLGGKELGEKICGK